MGLGHPLFGGEPVWWLADREGQVSILDCGGDSGGSVGAQGCGNVVDLKPSPMGIGVDGGDGAVKGTEGSGVGEGRRG